MNVKNIELLYFTTEQHATVFSLVIINILSSSRIVRLLVFMVTQLCFSLKSTLICRAFAFNFTAKYLQEPEVYPVFIQIEMCHRKILHFMFY